MRETGDNRSSNTHSHLFLYQPLKQNTLSHSAFNSKNFSKSLIQIATKTLKPQLNSPYCSKMHSATNLVSLAMTTLALVGMSQAWLLEFWGAPTCADPGHADTERGGERRQNNNCTMILDDMRSVRISDLYVKALFPSPFSCLLAPRHQVKLANIFVVYRDNNCTVALWPSNYHACGSEPDIYPIEPLFSATNDDLVKMIAAKDNRVQSMGDGSFCVRKVSGFTDASYVCNEDLGDDNV